jgi:large subunit ribosomal protein L25
VVVEPHGEPVGSQHGGMLEQLVHELEIRCLPGDLIDTLVVEVGALDLDDSMPVSELVFPEGVATTADPELVVFQVTHSQMAEEEEPEEELEEVEGLEEAAEGEEAPEAEEPAEEED